MRDSLRSSSNPRLHKATTSDKKYYNSHTCLPSPKLINEQKVGFGSVNNFKVKPSTPIELPHIKSQYSPRRSKNKEDERILGLIQRLDQQEESFHTRKAIILDPLMELMTPNILKSLSSNTINLLFRSILGVLQSSPPYNFPTLFCKTVLTPVCSQAKDIEMAYSILRVLQSAFPSRMVHEIARTMIMRITSAAVIDRHNAKTILLSLDESLNYELMKLASIKMVSLPLNGMNEILELVQMLLVRSNDVGRNPHYDELFNSMKMTHFAPHFQSFVENMTKALILLIDKDGSYAVEMRLFLLNHWTRNDPLKSTTFMREATSICTIGPEIDFHVWQKFSWMSSSIYAPLALAGLDFIEATQDRVEGCNNQVLIFLLEDTAKEHWCDIVREKATRVLDSIPQAEPAEPKKLPISMWIKLKAQAKDNYPEDHWNNGRRKRK